MNLYNSQQLLFSQTQPVARYKTRPLPVPRDFYDKGFTVFDSISSPEKAQQTAELFLANLDTERLPLLTNIQDRIQLVKADAIPMCGDSVETSFQALHFDMGQPIISEQPQLMISAVALYHPFGTPASGTKTRILSLKGLFSQPKHKEAEAVEKKLISYVKHYGDGWADTNTYRLQCFARVVDAVNGTNELANYRDKTMAQWFKGGKNANGSQSLKNEQLFYEKRGIYLDKIETGVELLPGQMVIIDNTRVVHGRFGKRAAKEIYQFMFGLEAAVADIDCFRTELVKELTSV
ncbi:hypothetical protein HY214_02370 [Candidatus Roizmanbacteria bacterium]|nr:hypothetical protein [Candidatus Roizmanbacteria bacterium]